MTHTDYYEKLDRILGFFYNHKDTGRITINQIEKANLFSTTREELARLVQKLIIDNKVDIITLPGPLDMQYTKHQITLDGILFRETTSYAKEYLKSLHPKEKTGHDLSNSTISNSTVILGNKNINQPYSPIDNLNITEIKKTINSAKEEKKQQNKIISLLLKYWWAIIIPTLVALLSLMIEYNWFAKK